MNACVEGPYVRRVPGLSDVVDLTGSGVRGMLDVNGVLYVVLSGSVVTVSGTTVTPLSGSIPGSDPVTIARNMKTTDGVSDPDIVAVRRDGGAYVLTSSTVSAYPDADLPETVNSVAQLDAYLVFTVPDARIFASELNSTDINALSFTTANARPDGLLRGITFGNQYYALGSSTIEVYTNVGTSPFPLQRRETVDNVGVIDAMAATGDAEAWPNGLFIVATDNTVRAITGMLAETVISTPDVQYFLSQSDPTTLDMGVFSAFGRSYLSVSSSIGSWVYDLSERAWHERKSTGTARWRATRGSRWGGKWVFGDTLSNYLLKVDQSVVTERGSAIDWMVEGWVRDFPSGVAAPALIGNFTAAETSVSMAWSRDGGATYSVPLSRTLAYAGKGPIRWNVLGFVRTMGFRIRFTNSSSVNFTFMGADAPTVQGRPA